jgi:hypothetical protein
VKGDEEASLGKGQGHPTPMIESSCNLDFDFTGALAGRGWPCLLLLIVDEAPRRDSANISDPSLPVGP